MGGGDGVGWGGVSDGVVSAAVLPAETDRQTVGVVARHSANLFRSKW